METALAERDVPAPSAPNALDGERPLASRISRAVGAVLPPALGAMPFVVLFVALVSERPRITAYGDRAVTALAVRDLLDGHQLLGAYSRYGWHHPGPAFFLPLAAAHIALGGSSWALDAGMLLAAAIPAGLIVFLVGHRFGWRAGMATAGAVGIYLHAIAPVTIRDPWNPWGLLLPMAVLVVLCAGAGAGSLASLSGAVLVTTLLVQTHVGAAPVSVVLLALGVVLLVLSRRGCPEPARWRTVAVIGPLLAAAALWVPPLVQQATGRDPNLSELWRFFIQGDPGHSLSTAVATVGSRLRLIPFGDQVGLMAPSPSVGWAQAWSGLATVGAYSVAGSGVAVVGHRAGNRFTRAAGILTIGAVWAAVIAVRSVQGPLDGFLVAWVTAIPLGLAAGIAALIPARRTSGGWRPAVVGATAGALAFGALGTTVATAAAFRAPPAITEDAPAVRDAWAQLLPHLGGHPGAVLLRVADPFAWPVQAGLALLIEEHGWQAHVTEDWAFMFGPSRRMTGTEPIVATLRAVTPQSSDETLTLDVSETFPAPTPDDLEAVAARTATILGGSVLFPPAAPVPSRP
ncbi:MAG: hypothetical protein NVS1B12_01820 [Acidimicrobiales bacterium]